jgi:hypothetical protein
MILLTYQDMSQVCMDIFYNKIILKFLNFRFKYYDNIVSVIDVFITYSSIYVIKVYLGCPRNQRICCFSYGGTFLYLLWFQLGYG